MASIKVTIVGAGQAGLLLGIGLLKHKYNVTIITDKTADEIYDGSILSNQAMFETALNIEQKYQLDFWTSECPKNTTIDMCIISPDSHEKLLSWSGAVKTYYKSVDQRLKFSRWLSEFQRKGGNLIIQRVSQENVAQLTEGADLVIIATGKGGMSHLFEIDEQRSEFNKPQRTLTCLYVNNMSTKEDTNGVRVNVIPGIGEYLIMSGLTKNGPCKMMQFEAIPGKEFDTWPAEVTNNDYLSHAIQLLKEYIPWEAKRCEKITLSDENAVLHGSFTPTIRKPIAKLLDGRLALGIGDSLTLLDPLGGQGANNAAKAADIYLQRIISNEKQIFDDDWMIETFEIYWKEHAVWATEWTSILLKPPAPHIIDYLQAASQNQYLANLLAEGFNNPKLLLPWIKDPAETNKIIVNAMHRQMPVPEEV